MALFVGIAIWIPVAYLENYPVSLHQVLVTNGFMGLYIAGFLMTAIPQFSKTIEARPWEIQSYFFLSLGLIVMALFWDDDRGYSLISIFQASALLAFIFVRITKRKATPPNVFIFAISGIVFWLLTSIANFLYPGTLPLFIIFQGLFTLLILGVDSRLIPGLLGHSEIVLSAQEVCENKSLLSSIPIHFYLLIGIMVLSFLFNEIMMVHLCRLIIYFFFAFKFWKLHLLPKVRTSLSWSIWISSWLFTLTPIFYLAWPDGGVHLSHAFFIGSVVLLTLMVSTRVIRAHGNISPQLENANYLLITTSALLLAAFLRSFAILVPDQYFFLISLSALILIFALLIWGMTVLRQVLK